MSEAKIEGVVARMIDIRDRRATLKQEFEEKDKLLREMYDKGEAWVLNALSELGVDSVRVASGTAFITTKVRSSIADWNAFSNFIRESGEVDMLQHRVSDTTLKEFMESNAGATPPGITVSPERVVNIRRS